MYYTCLHLPIFFCFFKVERIENNRVSIDSIHKTNTKYVSERSVSFDLVDLFE